MIFYLVNKICQKPISLIFSFKYPFISIIIAIIFIIALFIYLLHLFGNTKTLSEYFKEQKYYYDNEQPNLFTSILPIDFTKGITKVYDCTIDSIIDTDKINQNYKKNIKQYNHLFINKSILFIYYSSINLFSFNKLLCTSFLFSYLFLIYIFFPIEFPFSFSSAINILGLTVISFDKLNSGIFSIG